MALNVQQVRELAITYGWNEVNHNISNGVIGFQRGVESVNVYYNDGTVGSCPDSSRLGTTQLFRKNVTLDGLRCIFQDVRARVGFGYYYRRCGQGQAEPTLVSQRWFGVVHDSLLKRFVPGQTVMVALGDGWFGMDCNGQYSWDGNIPQEFLNKVTARQHQWIPGQPGIDLVAFGSDNTYFVQFIGANQQWEQAWSIASVSREFTACMKEYNSMVHTIAFAPKGGFFVKFKNRHYKWVNVPKSLDQYLNDHQLQAVHTPLPAVDEVTIGPNEEWFVRFDDGSWWCQGQSATCDARISQIHQQGGHIRQISFGANSTWLITYFDRY